MSTIHGLILFPVIWVPPLEVLWRFLTEAAHRGGVPRGPARTTSITTTTSNREYTISDKGADKASAIAMSWAYGEKYISPDEVLLGAQERAAELGCGTVSAGTGALLRLLAAGSQARAVVEIGTGAGVSGTWLLRGMGNEGVLTTIDSEAEHQQAAKETFAAERVRPTRTRTITGRALEVLPRLADGAYDLVLADADPLEAGDYVQQAVRLLRPGGLVIVPHALNDDHVGDPAVRDPITTAMRVLVRQVRDDERLVPAVLPVGDGVLVAARTA